MTGSRADALARLDVFVGEWVVQVGDGPVARSWFEWALDRQFLIQRTEIPVPEAPGVGARLRPHLPPGRLRGGQPSPGRSVSRSSAVSMPLRQTERAMILLGSTRSR
jgi:hypothetical protein